MYNRDFGGIKSEGQLYNMEREYNQNRNYEPFTQNEEDCKIQPEVPQKRLFKADFLRNLKLDDLILIGIGLLLLLDSEEENDIFTLLIALMLLF